MHVDGFRFDLAATLARQFYDVDRLSAFFDLVQQDPVVSQVKLIAEPWDVGEGGYQVGNFPPLWSEWNGKYRDTVRDFWRGQHATLPEFASRLTGSSDLYQSDGRRPVASVNFVTAHDGFTLADLVSYNHTAEGNELGPTISFKGIDNASYYRLVDATPEFYMDYTGTGNSFNVANPHSLQLIMDSLRYWIIEMHVDGFRFDLAAALAREFYDVDKLSTFFELVQQDPIVSQVKLIAEPWDVGPGGYQVGNFPPQWTEWNGKYRDTVRDFWRGEASTLGEFAERLTGSSDLYEHDGRRPVASINFVTAHDGFTLRDLVSYNEKHNEANGEDNKDGTDDNRSYNFGVEGPSDDPAIVALRSRQQRNFLSTLLVSQGVPMVLHGDELGRTQQGNNNSYAQDSTVSWVHWDAADQSLIDFTAALVRLRKEHPTFRRSRFFDGRPVVRGEGEPLPDIVWLQPDAAVMAPKDWDSGFGRAIAVFLNGDGIHGRDRRGERITDKHFLVLFNAGDDTVDFTLPPDEYSTMWEIVVDTVGVGADSAPRNAGDGIPIEAKSLMVLRAHVPTEAETDHSVAASLSTPVLPSVVEAPASQVEE
ncbi:MAG TPA: alpha-amylase family glycosyl hydrolase [Galbitalea sp.]